MPLRTVPTVTFEGRDLARLLILTRSTGHPGSLSCSPDGTVWVGASRGYHRAQQRQRLGQIPALDRLVALFLRDRPAGGRFVLADGVVRRAADGQPVAQLAIGT